MKAEINQRIAALLENPEIEAVRVEVRTAFEVYRDAREKDVKVQKEAWDKEERPAPEPGEEPIRFEYQADEEDTRNNKMYAAFREREKILDLFEALRSGDVEKALTRMTEHTGMARDSLLKKLWDTPVAS